MIPIDIQVSRSNVLPILLCCGLVFYQHLLSIMLYYFLISRRKMEVPRDIRISKSRSTTNSGETDLNIKTKRRRSDPVLWQKPLYQQKCQRDKVTTQTTPQKSSIKQLLRTDLGRSVGVTTATQLVWLTGLRAHLPTPRNSRVIKRTHI